MAKRNYKEMKRGKQDMDLAMEVSEVKPVKTTEAVRVHFRSPADAVKSIILASNQIQSVYAAGYRLRLISGRMYFIPVDTETDSDSDNAIIKVFSDMAGKIEVRFVKDGTALVMPLVNGIILRNRDRLCVLIKPTN